jgi:nucleotide-binding universal stress UspA family protein
VRSGIRRDRGSVWLSHRFPAALILNRARNGLFSLVMIGSQGQGFFEEVFLGSVSHSVARLAPLPVLFIPALR